MTPPELWVLADRHGVLMVFTDETKLATHLAGVDQELLKTSEVVRYVPITENGTVSDTCVEKAAE